MQASALRKGDLIAIDERTVNGVKVPVHAEVLDNGKPEGYPHEEDVLWLQSAF